MTEDQITTLTDLFADALRRANAPSESIELVLNHSRTELASNLTHVVTEFMKMAEGFDAPRMKVDHSLAPQAALDLLLGFEQDIDQAVAATMPRSCPDESIPLGTASNRTDQARQLTETVVYAPPSEGDVFRFIFTEDDQTDDDIMRKFASQNLRPATPFEVCRINQGNGEFTWKYPNVAIWKNDDGAWCFLACFMHLGKLYVKVKDHTTPWRKGFWIVGVPLIA